MVSGIFTHEVHDMVCKVSGIFKRGPEASDDPGQVQVSFVEDGQERPPGPSPDPNPNPNPNPDPYSSPSPSPNPRPNPNQANDSVTPLRNGTGPRANRAQDAIERVCLVDNLDTSESGQIKRLAELMWLMPMLIGNAVHGNADNPPVPMGPMAAYDLDSADEQQDKDEAGQRFVAKAVGPAYIFVYFIIVLTYFAGGQQS